MRLQTQNGCFGDRLFVFAKLRNLKTSIFFISDWEASKKNIYRKTNFGCSVKHRRDWDKLVCQKKNHSKAYKHNEPKSQEHDAWKAIVESLNSPVTVREYTNNRQWRRRNFNEILLLHKNDEENDMQRLRQSNVCKKCRKALFGGKITFS